MLTAHRFEVDRTIHEDAIAGALAVPGIGSESSIASAVSIVEADAERELIICEISYYTEPEDVADVDSGNFHPGIEATPHSDWSFNAQLFTDNELPEARREAVGTDFSFEIPVPQIELTLLVSGYGD